MKYILTAIILAESIFGVGQNSFTKILDPSQGGLPSVSFSSKVLFGNSDELSICTRYFPGANTPLYNFLFSDILLIELNDSGQITESNILFTPIQQDSTRWRSPSSYNRRLDFHASQVLAISLNNFYPSKQGLFVFNRTENVKWAKLSALGLTSEKAHIGDGFVLASRAYAPDSLDYKGQLGLSKFDVLTGESQWEYHYKVTEPSFADYSYGTLSIASFDDQVSSVGRLLTDDHAVSYLNTYNGDGEVLNSVIFDDRVVLFEHQYKENGNIVVTGKVGDNIWNYEGFLAEFDADLNLIWATKLMAAHFSCFYLTSKLFPNGDLLFINVAYGDFPVVVGRVTSSGELLNTQGFAFFSPTVDIAPDNSIAFYSGKVYLEDGTTDFKPHLIKTDTFGIIEECRQYDACMELQDFALETRQVAWSRSPAPPLPDLELMVQDVDVIDTEPFCGTPIPPSPYFSLPDTICQGVCLRPDSLNNRLAHHAEWRITGMDMDTVVADTVFDFCFNLPGVYEVKQTIWLLGCASDYSKQVRVLPNDLLPFFSRDTFVCGTSATISAADVSRPLRSFRWQDGSTSPTLTVSQASDYILVADDGYCSATDTIEVRFFEDEFPLPVFGMSVLDTAVCEAYLPVLVQLASPYVDSFLIGGTYFNGQDGIRLPEGRYEVSTTVSGCLAKEEINIMSQDCRARVYLPNVFSPNQDGVNDYFEPLGQDFTPLRLSIYDRWGSEVFVTNQAPFRWYGKSQQTGTYLVVFKFYNELNEKEEILSSDLLLLNETR